MKSLKILPILLIGIFLISFASATITCDGGWEDSLDIIDIEINDEESINFWTYIFSYPESSITSNIKLYSPTVEGILIYSFPEESSSEYFLDNTYTLTPDMYTGPGNYEIVILGSDEVSSDTHTLTLTVNDADPDTTAPTITLSGANPQYILLYDAYTELGATATDDVEGDITSSIVIDSNAVDTSTEGSYIVTYNVQDSSGNTATQATRIVTVADTVPEDTNPPAITIINPTEGTTYTSSMDYINFFITDANLDFCTVNDGTGAVTVACNSGELTTVSMTSVEGTNTWTVYAIDDYGNSATTSVNFNVNSGGVDITAPIITIISPEDAEYDDNTITFQVLTNEEATVEFSLDGESRITMSNPSNNIFRYTITGLSNGDHDIVFYATDETDNEGTENISFSINTEEDEDDDDKVSSTSTPEEDDEQAYLDQFNPKTIYLNDDEVEEELSWFQKLIRAIKDFLKRLFGLK